MSDKIRLLLAIALCSVAVASCGLFKHSGSSKNLAPGTWQATPINIDGNSSDWPAPYPNYDVKAKIGYATSNDSRNLYVTAQTGDLLTQMKILKQGMTLLIDTGGGKDGQVKINYPLESDVEMPDPKKDLSERRDNNSYASRKIDQILDRAMQSDNQYSLEGSGNCNGGYIVTQTAPCGIRVRARLDEFRQLVWEAAIPFSLIFGKDTLTANDAHRPISVCFTVNRFVTKTKTSGGDNSGMNGSNMGGTPGTAGRNSRSMQSSGRNNLSDPFQHLYERTTTWKQFTLEYQK